MHMQMQDKTCCTVQDPNCKMLRAYFHNDYDDDDGRVDNDDYDSDDADECSYVGYIYCRFWMMTFLDWSLAVPLSGVSQDRDMPKVRLTFALR